MKKYLKKTLSVFLALLMVVTSFVFAPEMFTIKADAAATKYYWRVVVDSSNATGGWDQGDWTVYGKPNNGTGAEKAISTFSQFINFNQNGNVIKEGDSAEFPTKVTFQYSFGGGITHRKMDAYIHLEVRTDPENVNSYTRIGSVQSYSYEWGKNSGTKTLSVGSGNYPAPSAIESWAAETKNVISPSCSTKKGYYFTGQNVPTFCDQYGVGIAADNTLIKSDTAKFMVVNDPEDTAEPDPAISGFSVENDGSNKAKIFLNDSDKNNGDIRNWVLDNGESRTCYVRAYVVRNENKSFASDCMTVSITNHLVNVNYNLNNGEYWGTDPNVPGAKEDQTEAVYWGKTVSNVPATAYRRGYTFKGIYTTKTGSTPVANNEYVVKANHASKPKEAPTVTYYAQWTPIKNRYQFLNSDGQPYNGTGVSEANYDTPIRNLIPAGQPQYPGGSSSAIGDYHFAGWVVDNCEDPALIGASIDTYMAAHPKLNSENSAFVLTFKATYTAGTPKTYSANFKDAAGVTRKTEGGKYYWNEVAIPADDLKPDTVTAANGFELDKYDYFFAGWTTAPSKGNWGTEEDVEYTSADTYRIKSDVTFYPCYSNKIKQCVIKINYVAGASDEGLNYAEKTVQGPETELGKNYNPGLPTPPQYNYYGQTYRFIRWLVEDKDHNITSLERVGDRVSDLTNLTGDYILMAEYDPQPLELHGYFYNGDELVEDIKVNYNSVHSVPSVIPTKDRVGQTGYTFKGWSASPDGSTGLIGDTFIISDENNHIYYAIYDEYDYYTVSFRDNSGAVLQTSKDYVAGDSIAYVTEAPTEIDPMKIPVVEDTNLSAKYAIKFVGWKSNVPEENTFVAYADDGKTVADHYAIPKGQNITVSGDRTYSAVFERSIRDYTIKLYAVGSDMAVDEPVATIVCDYGTSIPRLLDALYTDENGRWPVTDLDDVRYINGQAMTVTVGGEVHELPYSTPQYKYSFNGWTPTINATSVVTGNAEYKATYKTESVPYYAHWLVPRTEDIAVNGSTTFTDYNERKVQYLWGRTISTPLSVPSVLGIPDETGNRVGAIANNTPGTGANAHKTWIFKGWYVATLNEDGTVTVTDTPYERGTPITADLYYAAKFGWESDVYTVNVYSSESKTTLLGSYTGTYDSWIYIPNFKKAPDDAHHYTLTNIGSATAGADGTTSYKVTENEDIWTVYRAEPHNYNEADGAVKVIDKEPTYAEPGSYHMNCAVCNYKGESQEIPALIDNGQGDLAPKGKIAISGYEWGAKVVDPATEAYISHNSIISIITTDIGYGVNSVVYTWYDKDGNVKSSTTVNYGMHEATSKNIDFSLPDDFADGDYIGAVITDHANGSVSVQSGKLYIDTVKPKIKVEATCLSFAFSVEEEHIGSIEITCSADETFSIEDCVKDEETGAYTVENATAGTYTITVIDKAGNKAKDTFSTSGAHQLNQGVVTIAATCTESGVKTIRCVICGHSFEEEIRPLGHDWNTEEDGTTPKYTVDVKADCIHDGSKSIHCRRCDVIKEGTTEVIPALGHDFKTVTKDANCTDSGYTVTTCSRCSYWTKDIIDPKGHTPDLTVQGAEADGTITVPATCSTPEKKYKVCAVCGKKYDQETGLSLPHSYKVIEEGDCIAPAGTYTIDGETYTYDTSVHYYISECEHCGLLHISYPELKNHHFVKGDPAKTEADCDNDAVYTWTCSVCGKTEDRADRLTSLGHVRGEMQKENEVEATCTTVGGYDEVVRCTRCDYVFTTRHIEIPALGHNWELTETITTPTCKTEGEGKYVCANCGEEKTDVIPVTEGGHSYGEGVVTKEATCSEDGVMTYTCTLCDETVAGHTKTEAIPATGVHTPDLTAQGAEADGTITVAAACDEDGKTYKLCSMCGKEYDVVVLPKTGHTMGGWVVTTEPKCGVEGVETNTCSTCGVEETRKVVALEHDYVPEVTNATCYANAYTTYTCSICGDNHKNISHFSKLQHEEEEKIENDVAATCTEDGSYDKVVYCNRCHAEISREKVTVKATGHNYVGVITKVATCAASGVKTFTCVNCNDSYTEEIPATGEHNWILDAQAGTASTCTVAGSEVYNCSVCKQTKTETLPLAEHVRGERIDAESTPATCEKVAKYVYQCINCTDGRIVEYGADKAPHTKDNVLHVDEPAECEKDGKGTVECSVCGQTFTGERIPATGHKYGEEKTVEPTCDKGGETYRLCSVCGYKNILLTTEAAGHKWETVTVQPSCTEDGYTCKKCSVCGIIESGSETPLPITGHTYGDEIHTKEPTCTEKGYTYQLCETCGYENILSEIDAKGHTASGLIKITTAPTCMTKGIGTYKCSVCGAGYEKEIPADPNAHAYGSWSGWTVTKAANCTDAGEETRTLNCVNEGCTEAITETREIAALGHNLVTEKPDTTSSSDGLTVITHYWKCTRCDYTTTTTSQTSSYTVTVNNLSTGVQSTVILTDGEKLTAAHLDPLVTLNETETTYEAVRWMVDGHSITLPYEVNGNITVNAQIYTVNKTFTVTFYDMNGKKASEAEYAYGETVVVPTISVVNPGFKFVGWREVGTENVYTDETIPTVTATVSYQPEFETVGDITVYYVFFKNESGSKTLFTETIAIDENGTYVTKPEVTPEKAANSTFHYSFKGWTETKGSTAYFDFSAPISGNVTLYASFSAVKHTDAANIIGTTSADCTNSATTTYKCSCGYTWTQFTAPPTGHTYGEGVTVEEGNKTVTTYTCTKCGYSYKVTQTHGPSQTSTISITVVDNHGNPLEGANVLIYRGNLQTLTATTNSKGVAVFPNIESNPNGLADGSYQVKAEKEFYSVATGTVTVVKGTGAVTLSCNSAKECHCICHANSFFGKIRRWFNMILRFLSKNYKCCSCGYCETIW